MGREKTKRRDWRWTVEKKTPMEVVDRSSIAETSRPGGEFDNHEGASEVAAAAAAPTAAAAVLAVAADFLLVDTVRNRWS